MNYVCVSAQLKVFVYVYECCTPAFRIHNIKCLIASVYQVVNPYQACCTTHAVHT